MSYRLNPSSDHDLRVAVLSESGDEDFNKYSKLVVLVKSNTASITRTLNLTNEYKRVDVNFDEGSNFFVNNESYVIIATLEGVNVSNVSLKEEFKYKSRPGNDFSISLTSNKNIEDPPTPFMKIQVDQYENKTIFNDVRNIHLIVDNSSNDLLKTFSLPVPNGITKSNDTFNIYIDKKNVDISDNSLILEISGSAFENSVYIPENVYNIDISADLISAFGDELDIYITMETDFGTTESRFDSITLTSNANAPQLKDLKTNTTDVANRDLNNLFVKFDISPNSTDENSEWGINSDHQVKYYKFIVYDVTDPEVDEKVGETLILTLDQDSNLDYKNNLNVTIDENGSLTTIYGGLSDVSGNFGTSFQFVAPRLYRVDLSAKSGETGGVYSPTISSSNFRLEKLPTITFNNPSFGPFINHTVTDYEATFHVDISDTIYNAVSVQPSLQLVNIDSHPLTLTTTDVSQNISTGSVQLNLVFDISNNTTGGNKERALFTDKVFGQFYCTVTFEGGYQEYVNISSTFEDNIKTMEEVYTALGVEIDDISLNSDSNGDANGFKLTIDPSTEIFELKNVQSNIINIYNGISDHNRSKITSNLEKVEVSGVAFGDVTKELSPQDISDNLGKYVFDVPVSELGKNLTYNFRIVNDVSGKAPSTTKDASLTTRVNDVRVIDTSFDDNANTITISNKLGYQLGLAIQETDGVSETLYNSTIDDNGDPILNTNSGFTGEQTNDPTLIFTDPSLGDVNTQLYISLSDKGEGANNQSEVFSFTITESTI